MVKKLNLALFGAGRIGFVHFKNMLTNERAQITWIVEFDVSIAKELVQKFDMADKVKVTSQPGQALSDPSVDGVMICTPHQFHHQIALESLKSGKSVFCEKPLSLLVQDSIECYDVAKTCKLPLMCALNRRFDPQTRLIYNRVKQGEIGTVRAVQVCCREPRGLTQKSYLQASGGIFLDAMVHQIDIANFMVDDFPETVYVTGHASNSMYLECNDLDTAFATLKYPSGAVATLETSREAPLGYDQRLEVLGTEGLLQGQNQRPLQVLQWNEQGVHQEPIYNGMDRYQESYKLEVEHFIDVLKGSKKLDITSGFVIASIITAHACKVSFDTQQVINLVKYARDNFNYEFCK